VRGKKSHGQREYRLPSSRRETKGCSSEGRKKKNGNPKILRNKGQKKISKAQTKKNLKNIRGGDASNKEDAGTPCGDQVCVKLKVNEGFQKILTPGERSTENPPTTYKKKTLRDERGDRSDWPTTKYKKRSEGGTGEQGRQSKRETDLLGEREILGLTVVGIVASSESFGGEPTVHKLGVQRRLKKKKDPGRRGAEARMQAPRKKIEPKSWGQTTE